MARSAFLANQWSPRCTGISKYDRHAVSAAAAVKSGRWAAACARANGARQQITTPSVSPIPASLRTACPTGLELWSSGIATLAPQRTARNTLWFRRESTTRFARPGSIRLASCVSRVDCNSRCAAHAATNSFVMPRVALSPCSVEPPQLLHRTSQRSLAPAQVRPQVAHIRDAAGHSPQRERSRADLAAF